MSRRRTKKKASPVSKVPGDLVVTSADVARIEAEIHADMRRREEADARIAVNRKLLAAAQLLASHAGLLRTIRKASTPATSATVRATEAADTMVATASVQSRKLPRGGGSVGIVSSVLRDHPDGIAAPELKRKAGEHPDASKSLREHGQYIYSILETLERRGEAEKLPDGRWRTKDSNAAATLATAH